MSASNSSNTIACLGPEGTFSHIAALTVFSSVGPSTISFYDSFDKAFTALSVGISDYAVLPIENSTEGMVGATYTLLVDQGDEPDVQIVGETYQRIDLSLVAPNGASIDQLKTLHTRDIAAAQCKNKIKNMLGEQVTFEYESSTAKAASTVSKLGDITKAAIAGEWTAPQYGLVVLAQRVQDYPNNATRFVILGKRRYETGRVNKATVALLLHDGKGMLSGVFRIFANNEIDIRGVKTCPVKASAVSRWKHWLFVDARGQHRNLRCAVKQLHRARLAGKLVSTVRELGYYRDGEPDHGSRGSRSPLPSPVVNPSIDDIIKKGEGDGVEFKGTFGWSLTDGKREREVEFSAIKTIVGYMNADGGQLIIGVSDSGEILGLESDYQSLNKGGRDGFELHLRNRYHGVVGKQWGRSISVNFFERGGKDICMVTVKPTPKPIWIKGDSGEELFVRLGNQTERLSGKSAVEYIQAHWD